MEENDIFDLWVAKEENKFVEKSLLLESDVFSDQDPLESNIASLVKSRCEAIGAVLMQLR